MSSSRLLRRRPGTSSLLLARNARWLVTLRSRNAPRLDKEGLGLGAWGYTDGLALEWLHARRSAFGPIACCGINAPLSALAANAVVAAVAFDAGSVLWHQSGSSCRLGDSLTWRLATGDDTLCSHPTPVANAIDAGAGKGAGFSSTGGFVNTVSRRGKIKVCRAPPLLLAGFEEQPRPARVGLQNAQHAAACKMPSTPRCRPLRAALPAAVSAGTRLPPCVFLCCWQRLRTNSTINCPPLPPPPTSDPVGPPFPRPFPLAQGLISRLEIMINGIQITQGCVA